MDNSLLLHLAPSPVTGRGQALRADYLTLLWASTHPEGRMARNPIRDEYQSLAPLLGIIKIAVIFAGIFEQAMYTANFMHIALLEEDVVNVASAIASQPTIGT